MPTPAAIAHRIERNMLKAGIEPRPNSFLLARAFQILLEKEGKLFACRVDGEERVLFQDTQGLFWDLAAGTTSSDALAIETLPPEYSDLQPYEWPDDFDSEFTSDLIALCWPEFHIANEPGPSWTTEDYYDRLRHGPSKFELVGGRLFLAEEHRLLLLAALLEQVGVDRAVQLGDPAVWRRAILRLP